MFLWHQHDHSVTHSHSSFREGAAGWCAHLGSHSLHMTLSESLHQPASEAAAGRGLPKPSSSLQAQLKLVERCRAGEQHLRLAATAPAVHATLQLQQDQVQGAYFNGAAEALGPGEDDNFAQTGARKRGKGECKG